MTHDAGNGGWSPVNLLNGNNPTSRSTPVASAG
jgi:hypothetical protein